MANRRQQKVGVVTSNKMTKTVAVKVDRQVTHPLYKRVVRHSKQFLAHDEKNEAGVGDKVRLLQVRPISKEKRWKILSVLSSKPQLQI